MLLEAQTDQAIRTRLAEELAEVESRFAAELLSDLPCVNTLVNHIERYRGKMLRPMLVITTGMASSTLPHPHLVGTPESDLTDAHRVVATVTEMVHMATLVHDDILDEAEVRRRGATINHLQGNEAAVMLGDYLISHAYHLCSSLDNQIISRIIADTTNTVCEGELLQLANRHNLQLDEKTYFEIIRRKTASLCGTCCQLGAMLHGTTKAVADRFYSYGEKLGIAFQIVDDVLDLTGTEDAVGKTLGRDLQKGKLTLPLIHCLATAGDGDRQRLVDLLTPGSEPLGAAQIDQIRALTQRTGSVEYASRWAQKLVLEAKAALDVLPESTRKTLLLEMAQAVLTRKF